MTQCAAIDELRRLLNSRERRRIRSVLGGVRFPLGEADCFVCDATALRVISEEEPARQARQRINLAVRRLVG